VTALDEHIVTHDQALDFVPEAVAAEFRRGPAHRGEYVPGTHRRPIAHGTTGGYRAHFRHGEPMCEPCRAAERARLGHQNPQKAAACGTDSGYGRHLKRKEPACEPCKDAHNARQQQYMRDTGRVTAPVPRKIKYRDAA
jgi:hypothetical protein